MDLPLYGRTKIITKYHGVLNIAEIRHGHYVQSPDGWAYVNSLKIHRRYSRKYRFIFTDGTHIVAHGYQQLYTDINKDPILLKKLRKGMKVISYGGTKEVARIISNKDKKRYYGLYVDSYYSQYYIENGLLVSF